LNVAAIAVTAASTAVILLLLGAALSLRRSARELRLLVEEMSEHASSVLTAAEDTISHAQAELARVDDLMGSAEAITKASHLAHAAVATPLIKVLALGAGTARAGRRFRSR
jgi:hypothetical protein